MVSELKEIKNFSKASVLCVYGQRAERNKKFSKACPRVHTRLNSEVLSAD